jgi:hypothetical protein
MPPIAYCSISKEALLRKYTEENWGKTLMKYHCDVLETTRKRTQIWRVGQTIMAIVTWHRNPKSIEMVVRLLREGDTIWDIDHCPRVNQAPLPVAKSTDEKP